jgi:hypothetical protein
VPLQESAGDGGLYTLWPWLLVLRELLLLVVRVVRGRSVAVECRKGAHAKRSRVSSFLGGSFDPPGAIAMIK